MCGILGGNFKNWDYKKGIESMRHRGPDGNRICEIKDFTLAFTRLSIMDLSDNGMQPMCSYDRKVWICYNGEIYGFSKLSNYLKNKYNFKSTSDTEVILNAYLEYGDKFIDHIDGMFAIAILDLRERRLKLYRDRAGIKPLYYYLHNGNIAFASELKGLTYSADGEEWKKDYTAVYDYMFYGYIPDPKTEYQECYKLEPGYYLFYDIDRHRIIKKERYWKLRVNHKQHGSRCCEDISNELRELIRESVRDQLVADVPVGTFLSGGIDSSIISYEADRISPNIKTFTIGFKEKKYDESEYARKFANEKKINIKSKIFYPKDMDNLRSQFKEWYDEPFADTSAFPTYMVSDFAKQSATVVLTGDGGDELFGGYERYRIFYNAMKGKKIDNVALSDVAKRTHIDMLVSDELKHKYLYSGIEEYRPVIFWTQDDKVRGYKRMFDIPDDYDVTWYIKKYYHVDLPPITRVRYVDFMTYLPGDILTKVDRTSMAVSLETRVPFLSRKLIEFAFSLAENECCEADNLKKCLKAAYKDVLPEELINRKKRGFSIPPFYRDWRTSYMPVTSVIFDKYWEGDYA